MLILILLQSVGLPAQTTDIPPHEVASVDARRAITSQRTQDPLQVIISLDLSGVTLEEALRSIVRQSGIELTYQDALVRNHPLITAARTRITVGEALKVVLAGTGLEVETRPSGAITLRKIAGADTKPQATGTITGRVSDSTTGEALVGATVIVEGKKLSTVTDSKGNFSIRDVPVGTQQLSVRLVGYKVRRSSVEVNANKTARVMFVLTTSSAMLSEIVTTASGRQRRMEVGNDISVINVDSVMQTAPINTVTDLLEHRVPGLTVQRTGGGPGDPAIIRIRGEGSITRSNEPIVIVDGIRIYSDETTNKSMVRINTGRGDGILATEKPAASQLDQIDPNSIATIEVLKGPSASALYGADAANGVIVITTKRGIPGKTHWTLNASRGTKQLPGKYPINYGYYGSGIGGYTKNDNNNCSYPCKRIVDRTISFQALNESRYTVLDRGRDSRVSLTVGGGVQVFDYSVTGTLSNSTGYLRLPQAEIERFEALHEQAIPIWAKSPEEYTTGSISSSLAFQPNERVSARIMQSLSRSLQQKSSLDGAFETLQFRAIDTNRLSINGIFGEQESPFHRTRVRNLSSKTAITANWQVKSWLPLTTTAGIDLVNRNDELVLLRGFDPFRPLGGFRGGASTTLTQTFSLGLGGTGVTIPIAGARLLSVTSGVNVNRWSRLSRMGLADSMPLGAEMPSWLDGGSQQRSGNIVAGWFMEPKLNIQSRFFVVPGFRFDGSNVGGGRAGFSSFPRLSFSWIASDEPFWPRGTGIDNLRLRTALGYGGRLPQAGSHLRLLAYGPEALAGLKQEVLGLQTLGNTKLVPERNKEIEVGLDAELWGNRANIGVTYAHGITDDAIVNTSIAPSVLGSGITIPVNIGRTRKQSLEATMTVRPIESRNMGLAVTTTFSRQSNIIDRLKSGVRSGGKDYIRYVEGYPIAGIWYTPVVLYSDLNGNGVLDDAGEIRVSDSSIFAGSADPRYMLTMHSSLTMLKGRVTVNAAMSYRNGEVRWLTEKDVRGCIYCSADNPDKVDLAQQALLINLAQFPQIVNALAFHSMSVNVNLPTSLTRHLKVNRSVISLQGSNLGTRTNYIKKDAGVGATKVGVIEGVPRPREWRLNMTVGL